MSLLDKTLRILGPALVFGVLGLLVMTENTGRAGVMRDVMAWLSQTFGPVPTGLLLVLAGVAWSMSAYFKLMRRS